MKACRMRFQIPEIFDTSYDALMIHYSCFRIVCTLAVLVLSCVEMRAQSSLRLGDIMLNEFPRVKAQFYAIDAQGQLVRSVLPTDVAIRENGVVRPVLDVTCASSDSIVLLSAVLTVDVSGSMGGENILIARAAARAWVYAMPPMRSECAISSFDNAAYLNQDFTADKSLLLSAIDKLEPMGGTDYTAGLASVPTGGATVGGRGKYKRVVVFLTDGEGIGDEAQIIASALQNDVRVYCVCLKMAAPVILRNVANATGGQWFEHISTVDEAEQIYRTILTVEQGMTPCEVAWQSEIDCTPLRAVEMELLPRALATSSRYRLSSQFERVLVQSSSSLRFGGVAPPGYAEKDVVITAGSAAVQIDDISCSHPAFSVVSGGAPPGFTLAPGESRTVRVRFAPTDSAYAFAMLTITGNYCSGGKVYLSGGFPSVRNAAPTLKITAPNGGEVFGVGADTTITWEGVTPDDTLQLDYSIDNGATWLPITDSAAGLLYNWTVPNTPSNQCLARLRQFPQKERDPIVLKMFDSPVTSVTFSPDGSFLLASNDEVASMWRSDITADPERMFAVIGGLQRIVRGSAFSPNGIFVAIVGENLGSGRIFDVATQQLVMSLEGHTQSVNYVEYSADGAIIATASDDNTAILWDAATGSLLQQLSGHNQAVNSARFDFDGTRVVTASNDKTARIWNTETGQLIAVLSGHTDYVRAADFSPDGTLVATASLDGSIRIWNASTGALLDILIAPAPVYDLDFSIYGTFLVAAYGDQTVGIWNYKTKEQVRTLDMNFGTVLSVRFGPDGNTVAAGAVGGRAVIWHVNIWPLQEAVSKAVWSIIVPSVAAATGVDMGTVFVGSARDSVVTRFLCNTSDVSVLVDTLVLEGAHSGDFAIVSGAPPFIIPPHMCTAVEFRFVPSATGVRTAQARVTTRTGEITIPLTGRGVQTGVDMVRLVDFGRVPVGALKDTTVAIVVANPFDESITVTRVRQGGPDDEQFVLLEPTLPFVLTAKQSDSLKVRFSPVRLGGTSGKIVFEHTLANQPFETQLYGEGVCGDGDPGPGDSVLVVVSNAEGASGKSVIIEVRVVVPSNRDMPLPARFEMGLRINGTVLFPVGDTPKGVLDGRDRIVTVGGVYDGGDEVIARMQFMPTLGNDDTVDLAVEFFTWDVCAVPTAIGNGRFVLTDVCRAGGTRLFSPDGSLAMSTYPNPAMEHATVEFDLRETGATTLDIVDVYGRSVARLIDGVSVKGSHSVQVDTSVLPAGSYVLLLQTRTAVLGTMIQVVP